MAGNMQIRGIGVRYTADISDFTMKMNNVKAQMKEVAAQSKKMGDAISDNLSVDGIGAGLLSFGASLGKVIGEAIQAAIKDKETEARIIAQTGVSKKEGAELNGISRDLNRRGLSTRGDTRLEEAIIASKQIGDYSPKEISSFSDDMAKLLKILPDADPKDTIIAANSATQSWDGLTMNRAFEIIYDLYTATGDLEASIDVLKEYAPHYAQMGFTPDQMVEQIRHGVETGVYTPDKTADSVKEANINWPKVTKEQIEALHLINQDPDEFFKKIRGGTQERYQAYMGLIEKIRKAEDRATKEHVMQTMFGTQGEDMSMNFFDTPMKTNIKQTQRSDDLKRAWDNYEETSPQQSFDELNGALNDLGITIGEKLLPAIIATTEWLTEVVNDINDFAKAHPTFTSVIAWLSAIVAILASIGGTFLLFTGAKKGVQALLGKGGAGGGGCNCQCNCDCGDSGDFGRRGKKGRKRGRGKLGRAGRALDVQNARRLPRTTPNVARPARLVRPTNGVTNATRTARLARPASGATNVARTARLARPAQTAVQVTPKVSGMSKAWNGIKNFGSKVGRFFRGGGGKLMKFGRVSLAGLLIWAIAEVISFGLKINGGLKNSLESLWFMLTLPYQTVKLAYEAVKANSENIKNVFKSAADWIANAFSAVGSALAAPFELMWEKLKWLWDELGKIYDFMKDAIPKVLSYLGDKISSIYRKIVDGLWKIPGFSQAMDLLGVKNKFDKPSVKTQNNATKQASSNSNKTNNVTNNYTTTFNSNKPITKQETKEALDATYARDRRAAIM